MIYPFIWKSKPTMPDELRIELNPCITITGLQGQQQVIGMVGALNLVAGNLPAHFFEFTPPPFADQPAPLRLGSRPGLLALLGF